MKKDFFKFVPTGLIAVALLAFGIGSGDKWSSSDSKHVEQRPASTQRPAPGYVDTAGSRGDTRLRWRVGKVDPRFEISLSDLEVALQRSISLWETAAGYALFERDERFGFPIELEFDHRQETVLEMLESKRLLARYEKQVSALKALVSQAQKRYESSLTALSSKLRRFNDKVQDHNRAVENWNRQGGAPEAIAELLNSERHELDRERQELTSQESEVDELRVHFNTHVERYNDLMAQTNSEIRKHNARFAGVKSTVGQCESTNGIVDRIVVFAFENHSELTLVLAHELGHALGLGHVQGTGSIMSEVERGVNGPKSLKLSAADKRELERVWAIKK